MSMHRLLVLAFAALLPGWAFSETLEDPTRPPAHSVDIVSPQAADSEPAYVLSSTLVAPGRRLAVINGKTLRIGERIGDARLVGIATDHVRLDRGGETLTLRLLPVSIKKPRSTQPGGRP